MKIIDIFRGPAGSGKSTKLRRVAEQARANRLLTLEVSAADIFKASLERLIAQAEPDVLLIDEWSPACGWRPENLSGPTKTKIYYAVAPH